jgi:hypothetical protein
MLSEEFMVIIAFTFALALACLATFEFISLMTLESANNGLKKKVRRLARENEKLVEKVRELELQKLYALKNEEPVGSEVWPEYLEDDGRQ